MKALLLCAGLGTRLRPLTDNVPKCLVPVHGRPLLDYWLRMLTPESGISEILVNTHHHADRVRQFVGNSPARNRITLTYEEHLLGTGGTVLKNRDFFEEAPFLVAHADNLTLFDPSEFTRAHAERPEGTALTMMTFDTPTPESCGIVELDSRGVVQAFHEKESNPPGRRANAAVYILEPQIVEFLARVSRETGSAVLDLSTQVIPHFMGKIATFHNSRYHRDIGTMESWEAAQRDFPE